MVFHWILSDSKSPQVSRTLLSILAVLNNAVIWIVSTRPPTSKTSSPFNNPLVTVPSAPITIGIIVTFLFHSLFTSLAKVEVLILLFTFLSFILCSVGTAKSTILQVLFFLSIIIRSGLLAGDKVIRLYVKIPQEFVRVVLLDSCWVVHVPFLRMVKFKFLAQFPVDHFTHPVVSSLILLQRLFAAFAYYVIDCFVSITT